MTNGASILSWEIERWQLSHDLSLMKEEKPEINSDEDEEDDEPKHVEVIDKETIRRTKLARLQALRDQPLSKWLFVGTTRGLRFRSPKLRPGIQYGYRVRCRNEKGWSLWSIPSVAMRTASAPPDPVEHVEITKMMSRLLSTQWSVPKCNGEPVVAYEVLHHGHHRHPETLRKLRELQGEQIERDLMALEEWSQNDLKERELKAPHESAMDAVNLMFQNCVRIVFVKWCKKEREGRLEIENALLQQHYNQPYRIGDLVQHYMLGKGTVVKWKANMLVIQMKNWNSMVYQPNGTDVVVLESMGLETSTVVIDQLMIEMIR